MGNTGNYRRKCKDCGKEFYITPNKQKEFAEKGFPLPTRCMSCRGKNRMYVYKPCKECGEPFPTSELEKEWYQKKGFAPPERCVDCRAQRRAQRRERRAGGD